MGVNRIRNGKISSLYLLLKNKQSKLQANNNLNLQANMGNFINTFL